MLHLKFQKNKKSGKLKPNITPIRPTYDMGIVGWPYLMVQLVVGVQGIYRVIFELFVNTG